MSRTSSSGGSNYDRYKLLDLIGRGSFGEVYRGVDMVTNKEVAIKVIDLEDIEEDIDEIQKEISMLKTCKSPNITEYYGSGVIPGTTQLMIVMELMAVSASDLVDDDNHGAPLPEGCIAYVVREVLKALVYLHSEHRIHRDVKAANILLSADGQVKVSDFGVSAQLSGTVNKRRTFVGSPLWMAPEVIEQNPETQEPGSSNSADGYNEQADIWSLGITAIEMAHGQPPRSNISSFRLLFMIVRDPPPKLEGTFSSEFKDFVCRCLQQDPAERPSASELLAHEFVRMAEKPDGFDQIISNYLQARPSLDQQKGSQYGTVTSANYATLPRWEFAGKAPKTDATVKSPGLLRPVTAPGGPVQKNSIAAETGTVKRALTDSAEQHADNPNSQLLQTAKASTPLSRHPLEVAARATAADAVEQPGTIKSVPPGRGTVRRVVIPNDPPMPDRGAAPSNGSPMPSTGASKPVPDAAGEAAAPLWSLIQPALASTSSANPQAATVAADALSALSRLERVQPGASRNLVGDMLAMLSVSSSPSLQPLKSSATAVFGAAAAEDSKAALPDMGPLGNFLIARWRESFARERMQYGQYRS